MLDAAAVSAGVIDILAAPAIIIFSAKAIGTILTPLLHGIQYLVQTSTFPAIPCSASRPTARHQ